MFEGGDDGMYGDFPEMASERLSMISLLCPRCRGEFITFLYQETEGHCPLCHVCLVGNLERFSDG